MRIKLNQIFAPFIVTIVILLVLEVISTSFLPILGFEKYKIPFNILIVLFLSFKLETPYLAILIFMFQLLHSYFSIEGWELGTFSGVMVSIIIAYLRDLIHLNSKLTTMIFTLIFQFVWFLIASIMLYLQMGDAHFIFQKFSRFIFEAGIASLIAPFLYMFLEVIWIRKEGAFGAEI